MNFVFSCSLLIFLSFTLLLISRGISGATFSIINKCSQTIWPGVLGNTQLGTTGFNLLPGESRSIDAPPGWSGRVWARTGCKFEPGSGLGTCATGGCSSNQVECNGSGASPPVTLAEFTIGSVSQDYYDVSLVDGYNLPMIVEASGSGQCEPTGCVADLNRMCPDELRDGSGQACRSACDVFGSPEYCCSGAHGTPDTCQPSVYSEMFKNACPRSYSYAYDDATSTFTCTATEYRITFCPLMTSQKSSRGGSSSVNATDSGDEFISWLSNIINATPKNTSSFNIYGTLVVSFIVFSLLSCLY